MFRRSMIDAEWLRQEYIVYGRTLQEIADEVGCSYATVRDRLIETGIKPRDSHHSLRLKKCLPCELDDREWLYEQYVVQEKSLNQIADILGVITGTVRSALVRLKIFVRSKSEGQRLRYKNRGFEDYFVFNKSVIEGCLLGDGFLKTTNPCGSDVYPVFAKRNIHEDHVRFVGKLIFSQNEGERIKNRGVNSGYSNAKEIFEISTLSHLELVDLYHAWYPKSNSHKKVVPQSIAIDEKVLLHWFMDDGYSCFYRRGDKKYLRVQFATQSFQKGELQMLCDKVEDALGIVMYPRLHQRHGRISGTGYYVELSQAHNQQFFDVIGPCPPEVSSMAYKWKLPPLQK